MLVFNNIPITKPADFYAHFDMSQAVEQESELLRFAERNLAYASLLDLLFCHFTLAVYTAKIHVNIGEIREGVYGNSLGKLPHLLG